MEVGAGEMFNQKCVLFNINISFTVWVEIVILVTYIVIFTQDWEDCWPTDTSFIFSKSQPSLAINDSEWYQMSDKQYKCRLAVLTEGWIFWNMLFSVNTNGICGQTLNKIIHFLKTQFVRLTLKFHIKKTWYLRDLAIQGPKKIPTRIKGEKAGKQKN